MTLVFNTFYCLANWLECILHSALLWVLRAPEAVEQLKQSFAEAIYHLVWFMIRVNIVWLEESKCGLISDQLVKYCLMHILN